MGFARYRQVKALEAQNKIDHTPKAVKEKTVTEKPKPNRSAQQARRQLTICEKEISTQETAIAEIEQRLEEAGGDYERYSEIYKEKEAAEETLGALMEKWETLGTVLDVDDTGSLIVRWDNGSGLHLLYGVDEYEKVQSEGAN